jgi:hypothetical protein
VDDELVAEQIEVDPLVGTSAFFTTEYIAVKSTGLDEVVDGDGYVERSKLLHVIKNTGESSILMGKF